MIKFMQENYPWMVPILVAVVSGIFGVFKLLQRKGKVHKQKIGNISDSHVLNINGDVNKKD